MPGFELESLVVEPALHGFPGRPAELFREAPLSGDEPGDGSIALVSCALPADLGRFIARPVVEHQPPAEEGRVECFTLLDAVPDGLGVDSAPAAICTSVSPRR